jgi:hypothetical protein
MKLLGWILVLGGLGFAQSDRGSITGVISDPAGAVVPVAAIEARNTATGGVYQAVSTGTGNYTLSELPTGRSLTAPGFKKFVREGLDVQVQQALRIDAALEVGAATESVTVSEAAPLLKTESGELSHNVTSERINELPVGQIGGIRNMLTPAQLLQGVVYNPGSVRLNGAPTNTQNTRIEGQDATYGLGQILNSVTQPSVDAIQEYAIQTSNYAAEFGQAGGGVFNVTMRSGTNQFHGSASFRTKRSTPMGHSRTPAGSSEGITMASPAAAQSGFPRCMTAATEPSSSPGRISLNRLSTPPPSTVFRLRPIAMAISAPPPQRSVTGSWARIF